MLKKVTIAAIVGVSIAGHGGAVMAKNNSNGVGNPKKSTCFGETINIWGTNKSDIIIINDDNTYTINGSAPILYAVAGTPHVRAVVSGGNGNDVITGSSWNDTICGGNGKDVISGGDGSDKIYGENAVDTLYGDDVANNCVAIDPWGPNGLNDGGNPDDYPVKGEDGILGTADDLANLPNCDDYIVGGNGKDYLQGGRGKDVLEGDNGPDTLDGGISGIFEGVIQDDELDGGGSKDKCIDSDNLDPAATFIDCEL